MATPATINSWLDQLAASLVEKPGHKKANIRKLQDAFRRRVKRHNYARTNQFEVENRLNGLEEKFQVLSLDNLSDALHQRRIELKPFENHWLPDVLDLFLHLAGSPTSNQTLLELYRIPPRIGTPPPLRWRDLLADSPVDRGDKLWRVPDFRDADDSGYDDDFSSNIGSTTSSPKHVRQSSSGRPVVDTSKILVDIDSKQEASISLAQYRDATSSEISEVHYIRECLFLIRGFNTDCFISLKGRLQLKSDVIVRGISQMAVAHTAQDILAIRRNLDITTNWTSRQAEEPHIAALKHATDEVLQKYYESIDGLQQALTRSVAATVTSLSSILSKVESIATNINTVAALLNEVGRGDSVTYLDTLYSAIQTSQLCNDTKAYTCLISLIRPALSAYLSPVIQWIRTGSLNVACLPPFIEMTDSKLDLRKIWNDQFKIAGSPSKRPTKFLATASNQVLACGKTAAFLNQLRSRFPGVRSTLRARPQFELPIGEDILLPFAQVFEQSWQLYVEKVLHDQTIELKSVLDQYCNFQNTLHEIQQLYFPQSGILMHSIDLKIFDSIDRCIDSWNDRFQLKDMLEDAFHSSDTRNVADSVVVHSAYTSSRTIQDQRTSVKILSSLSFEYVLSWPMANIVDPSSMTSYRRVALVLMQIRRAKYCLERTGYMSAVSFPIGPNANNRDQTFAQVLCFTLLTFINTLLDSVMNSIWPLTDLMQQQLRGASTVNDMIQIHQQYITRLECSCLAAPRLKILRQSLQSILDLCIRFSDLASNPSKIDQDGSDHEASSFISARSRNKSIRMEQYGSDDEGDDYSRRLGDGYSSFIVLDDDTSIIKELKKVKSQYERQFKFLISGLRGASKGGRDVVDLETLADRLSWLHTK